MISNILLVKEYDFNFFKVVGCECFLQGEVNKLFVMLYVENDGQGDVFDVYFDMEFFVGFCVIDIIGILIVYYLFCDDVMVSFIDLIEFIVFDDQYVCWYM